MTTTTESTAPVRYEVSLAKDHTHKGKAFKKDGVIRDVTPGQLEWMKKQDLVAKATKMPTDAAK